MKKIYLRQQNSGNGSSEAHALCSSPTPRLWEGIIKCVLWKSPARRRRSVHSSHFRGKLTRIHAVDILCGYSVGGDEAGMEDHTFRQICAEHSAVHTR